MKPSILPLLITVVSILLLSVQPALGGTATYLPLSYKIAYREVECIYEHISEPNEHLTSSVFVLSGEELRAAFVFEGPVAPVDLNLNEDKKAAHGDKKAAHGLELQRYLTRYDKEGTSMFINGKFGDNMMNVKPVRIAEMVDFEEEEEDYFDDYAMTEREREDFNEHHDLEHQHVKVDVPSPPPDGDGGRRKLHPKDGFWKDKAEEGEDEVAEDHRNRRGRLPKQEKEEGEEEDSEDVEVIWYDDDVAIARDNMRERIAREKLEEEAMLDDDFVKLQMDHKKDKRNKVEKEMSKEVPERRRIDKNANAPAFHGEKEENNQPSRNHRRLREEHPAIKLLAGEPYQRTIQVESPGWYRLCIHPKSHPIEVEMELRKSSTFGPVDRRTGHVPSLEEVVTHSEIRTLYEAEDDATILAEEGAIQDEDLTATKEQLRILEKVYADIIKKQLEERRTWNWRTIKNQHLHSHLVLGNLVETIVYMGITGWQVYAIRKWFGGGPSLGR